MNAEEALRGISEKSPLIHHLTNYVTVNLVANVTLSTGALPIMAHAREEVEEVAAVASALVLNMGTLDPPFIEAMMLAGKKANERGVPVIFDPVGAGATSSRTETAKRLFSELEVFAVCGNAGEIATLAGLDAEVRGVESLAGDAEAATQEAARTLGTVAAATGPTDYASDGERTLAVDNGHPLMGRIVGSGCSSTAVVGCLAAGAAGADGDSDRLETVAGALAYFGRAGELAAGESGAKGPGTFEPLLLDALAGLSKDPGRLDGRLRIKEV